MSPRVLFILKLRQGYSGYGCGYGGYGDFSSGLLNSAKFVVHMLEDAGIEVKLVQVVDNNDIDREVYNYKPDVVIIEAIWVIPEKFSILQRLHPNVQWVIRGHSDIPFLANEGIALKWLTQYVEFENVSIAANSESSLHDLRTIVRAAHPDWYGEQVRSKVLYLPNYYPHHRQWPRHKKHDGDYINIACFGAIRPLKNQLIQAVAAIEYANIMNKKLKFHINATRNEQGGNNVLRNIRALFNAVQDEGHTLVEHGWMTHEEFLKLLGTLDIGSQVSLSETFNIVAADYVVSGLPIVVSPEIPWTSKWVQANPTNSDDILRKMIRATDWRFSLALRMLNLRGLKHYCEKSRKIWLRFLFDQF